eukprot:scaffold525835_cov17-Prasinocladus_malaysianus.AAC.1
MTDQVGMHVSLIHAAAFKFLSHCNSVYDFVPFSCLVRIGKDGKTRQALGLSTSSRRFQAFCRDKLAGCRQMAVRCVVYLIVSTCAVRAPQACMSSSNTAVMEQLKK